jgi:hypothetical protein
MPRIDLIKKWITESGIKKGRICEEAGITRAAFSLKLKGERPFSVNDIRAFRSLGMSLSLIDQIFLT